MVKDYKARLRKAREKIKKSQERLVDTYLVQLGESYESLPSNKKDDLIQGLETLVQRLEREPTGLGNGGNFDTDQAKRIRRRMGFTGKALVEAIVGKRNWKQTYQSYLSRYENGRTDPLIAKSKFGQKYVAFLRDNGYREEN